MPQGKIYEATSILNTTRLFDRPQAVSAAFAGCIRWFNLSGGSAGHESKKDGLGFIPDISVVQEDHHSKEKTHDEIAIDLNASQ